MKTKTLTLSLAILSASLGYASSEHTLTYNQIINYVEDTLPPEIELGQIATLDLSYTDSSFSFLTFSIEEADGFSAHTENISWETSVGSDGYGILDVTGSFEGFFASDGQSLDYVDYTFYSSKKGEVIFPESFSDLTLAEFSFTFSSNAGNFSSSSDVYNNVSFSSVTVIGIPAVPEHKLTSLMMSLFASGLIMLLRRRNKRTAAN